MVATRSDVETVNKGFYDLKASLTTAEKQLNASRLATVDLGNQEFLSGENKELDPAAAPVVKALDHILSYAFEQRASDIHFEPKRELTLVRLRIDGILHDVHLIPGIVYQAVVSRIKLLSGLNLAEKRRPQDGRIKREQGGREIELRVSTMPTAFGEKAVLRIFDPDILLKGIDDLGLSRARRCRASTTSSRARPGIILVTGPTGSGKTTTLYSILKHLSKPEVNIVTIEDPIEMVFEDFNQVAVRPLIDITFSSALRTVLRQDPDIIMIGEIRDSETADHAVQAALTGHLVLSTLHTNDAPSSVTRLLDLGVPHFLITTTLIGVLAQRLVREICTHCTEEYEPTADEAVLLRMNPEKLKEYKFRRGRGCLHCRQTGYSGRTGIFEVLPMTDKVRAPRHHGGGLPGDLQGGPRGGHAHPPRGGDREGLPRHHDHDRDGPGHREVAGRHSGPYRQRDALECAVPRRPGGQEPGYPRRSLMRSRLPLAWPRRSRPRAVPDPRLQRQQPPPVDSRSRRSARRRRRRRLPDAPAARRHPRLQRRTGHLQRELRRS